MGAASSDELVVGLDLGATNMQIGVVDADNRIVGRARGRTEADAGQDRVITNIVTGVEAACDEARVSPGDLAAIGIAAAGAIDISQGEILDAPNLGWTDVPLRDMLREKFSRPIALDNDVNGAVWGEYSLGAGRGGGDLLGVWVGTGIGGGLVIGGSLYHGSLSTAGEIGTSVIFPGEAEGPCRLEDRCSRTGMSRTLRRLMPTHRDSILHRLAGSGDGVIDSEALAEAYRAGDPLAQSVIDEAGDLLGMAIANAVTLLSLDRVIIGGGITEVLGEPYVRRIRQSFVRHVFPARCRDCRLVMTELRADAALLGAGLLARDSVRGDSCC